MDFELSEEQGLLKDAIDNLIRKEYGFEQRCQYQQEAEGWSRTFWSVLCTQGFTALPFSRTQGGLGGGSVETMLVMEALGRGLVLEPYLSTIIMAGTIIQHAASPEQKQAWIPGMIAGEHILVLAHGEKQARYHLADVATTARGNGAGYVLDGVKTVLTHGSSADAFIVSARTEGERRDDNGISLFYIPADASGIRRRTYRTQDGLHACDLILEGVHLAKEAHIGAEGMALAAIATLADDVIAALAAEAVGCMQAMLEMTVEYLKQRHQFGGPIGRFQVLQHQAVEMLIELEQARSMAFYAALMVEHPDIEQRRRALSMVKVQISRSGRTVGQLALQLHGGIGLSEQYAIGHYFKRLTMIDALFGDAEHHMALLTG